MIVLGFLERVGFPWLVFVGFWKGDTLGKIIQILSYYSHYIDYPLKRTDHQKLQPKHHTTPNLYLSPYPHKAIHPFSKN